MAAAAAPASATSSTTVRVVGGGKILDVRGFGVPRGGGAIDHYISVVPDGANWVTNDGFADQVTAGNSCTLIPPNSDVSCLGAGVTLLKLRTFAGIDIVATQNFPLASKIDTGHGNDEVRTGDGSDFIKGQKGIDLIDGGAGADKIFGGNDGDQMYGGTGADLLVGGAGDDYIDSRDNSEDKVVCSSGSNDTVDADTLDRVYHNCENVTLYPPTP